MSSFNFMLPILDDLTFSDEPEGIVGAATPPATELPEIVLPTSAELFFAVPPVPPKTPKTTKRQKAQALRRKKLAASLREKRADAAARQRDPDYRPLKFKTDYHLGFDSPENDRNDPITPKLSSKANTPVSDRKVSSTARKRSPTYITDDSDSSERPLRSGDESYTPSGKGNKKKVGSVDIVGEYARRQLRVFIT